MRGVTDSIIDKLDPTKKPRYRRAMKAAGMESREDRADRKQKNNVESLVEFWNSLGGEKTLTPANSPSEANAKRVAERQSNHLI